MILLCSTGTLSAAQNNAALMDAPETCKGPWKHQSHVAVYSIKSKSASKGVDNKNAADALGDMAFIFGTLGYPLPRGVQEYWDGVIEVNHISLDKWGAYQRCNHASGSTVYHCTKECPWWHPVCDAGMPGKRRSTHTNFHAWYSFPAKGKGKYWDYETGKGCERSQVEAKCVIKKLAEAAGCPDACAGPNDSYKCALCMVRAGGQTKLKAWNDAIHGGGCTKLATPDNFADESEGTSVKAVAPQDIPTNSTQTGTLVLV